MTSTSRPGPGSSTNVRNLLRAELASSTRRINHPYASYRLNKILTCTICNLVIRSESLWEGHLRSANHRKNLHQQTLALAEASGEDGTGKIEAGTKRKAEQVESDDGEDGLERQDLRTSGKKRKAHEEVDEGDDTRKKTKSDRTVPRTLSFSEPLPGFVPASTGKKQTPTTKATEQTTESSNAPPPSTEHVSPERVDQTNALQPTPQDPPPNPIDESEWAAFEREIQPLAAPPHFPPTTTSSATITITAAPVSASDLALRATAAAADKESTRSRARDREAVAEAEREDEAARVADEWEVQDEMERKVRRWRERREALRRGGEGGDVDGDGDGYGGGGGVEDESGGKITRTETAQQPGGEGEDDDEDEDEEDGFDDWGLR